MSQVVIEPIAEVGSRNAELDGRPLGVDGELRTCRNARDARHLEVRATPLQLVEAEPGVNFQRYATLVVTDFWNSVGDAQSRSLSSFFQPFSSCR